MNEICYDKSLILEKIRFLVFLQKFMVPICLIYKYRKISRHLLVFIVSFTLMVTEIFFGRNILMITVKLINAIERSEK